MVYFDVHLQFFDIEAPIVFNSGFSFRVLYPSVLLSCVFTNMHKPKNWEDPQNDIPDSYFQYRCTCGWHEILFAALEVHALDFAFAI